MDIRRESVLKNIKQSLKKTILYRAFLWIEWQEGKRFPIRKAKRNYKKVFNKELNLENPQALTEKINWLKLFDYPKNPLVILAGDKWGLRTFLEERGLSYLSTPVLFVYDSIDEICWDSLPEKFAIKKSNASAFNILITKKDEADEKEVKEMIKRWLKTPFGYLTGEHHYEKMQPKIIVEKFIENIGKEWRIICINGKPEVLQTALWAGGHEESNKAGRLERGLIYSDFDGRILGVWDCQIEGVRESYVIGEKLNLPSDFPEMLELSTVLSKDFPFVRVDFFHGENRLILGELTFTPANGFGKYPESILNNLGEKLILPKQL